MSRFSTQNKAEELAKNKRLLKQYSDLQINFSHWPKIPESDLELSDKLEKEILEKMSEK